MKKTAFIFLVCSICIYFTVQAQEAYPYEVIKEGSGEKPTIGKEIGTSLKIMGTDGTLYFDSDMMMIGAVMYSELTGESEEDAAYERSMMLMPLGSVYTFRVPKAEMKEAPFYSQIEGDELFIETAMLEINDIKPNGARMIEDVLREEGLVAAKAKMAELLPKKGAELNLREWDMNGIGYELLAEGKVEEAVAIFAMNVEMYPGSANVYDSLGEAYQAMGNKDEAVKQYKKALEIDASFQSSIDHLKALGEGE
ncbi:MAG: tetratricopeptide repeat protein [Bacteroidota bacterium]